MSNRRALDEAKKGSAEIVILAIVEHESHHGYEIAKLIEQKSGGSLTFTLASLYAGSRGAGSRGPVSAAAAITESPTPGGKCSSNSAPTGAPSSRHCVSSPAWNTPEDRSEP
jgi:hypothetical protein